VKWTALAAALTAAALLPNGPLGIGVVLVAALVAATAAAARRPTGRTVGLVALALALASVAAVRDAGWVVAIDLAAAWLTASFAVAGPRIAALLAPLARLRELPSVAPSMPEPLGPAVRGTLLGGVLLLPFASLFLAADAAFAELGGRVPFPSVHSLPVRISLFVLVLLGALGLALAARRPPKPAAPRKPPRFVPLEWAIPLVLLDLLFLSFVLVQLTVLFGGHDHVLETAGLTYAEYAREGFWELLAAAGLTLAVVGGAAVWARTPRPLDRLLLRLLLGILCVLTIVILASALHRLHLYEDAFGLTRLRLAAEASSLWLGGAFALVVVAGLVARVRRELPAIAVAGTALALLGFSLADPDGRIAARNVEHWRDTGRIDLEYVGSLSADAAPALDELPEPLRAQALAPIRERLEPDEPWSSANLARRRARSVLQSTRPTSRTSAIAVSTSAAPAASAENVRNETLRNGSTGA
jgi:Domain of unknown function (DUF4173)